ncbi:SRPBCC domain-containing protein [Paradevosia shaoguanensis]|uniref:SRPBCC domain-containing protein n=1 Tax=Paradevosia shaoguanensis TaxID=1335043 RepID=UPI003C70842F
MLPSLPIHAPERPPHSLIQSSFLLERDFPAPAATVFAAWAEPARKARWFSIESLHRHLDFRVGGHEFLYGRSSCGRRFTYEAVYREIVPDLRIVFSYDIRIEGRHGSSSLASLEIAPHGKACAIRYCEQGIFLDGLDSPRGRFNGATLRLARLAGMFDEKSLKH